MRRTSVVRYSVLDENEQIFADTNSSFLQKKNWRAELDRERSKLATRTKESKLD